MHSRQAKPCSGTGWRQGFSIQHSVES